MDEVKWASVIQVSSPDATTRFALHCTFDGVQRHMIQAVERGRALFSAFGDVFLQLYVFGQVLNMSPEIRPCAFSVVNSDTEGFGPPGLGFGVNRFDDKMTIFSIYEHPGRLELLKTIFSFFTGKCGEQYKAGSLPKHVDISITNSYELPPQDGHNYVFYCDGTSSLPIQGESMSFQVKTNAIPYFCMKE